MDVSALLRVLIMMIVAMAGIGRKLAALRAIINYTSGAYRIVLSVLNYYEYFENRWVVGELCPNLVFEHLS